MSESSTLRSEGWIKVVGSSLGLVAIAIVLLWYLKKDYADVFLDVSTQPALISGTVSFEGIPVDTGTVHIVVSDAKSKRYLFGTTRAIDKEGRFTVQGPGILGGGDICRPLWVSADFRGSFSKLAKADSNDAQASKNQGKAVSGETTVYLNCLSPYGRVVIWGVVGCLVALLGLTIVLFTGEMGKSKARGLFLLMYFFTFVSLALPIAISVVVTQNPYMLDTMEASPIGLVRATTKGLTDRQWLINIGGAVVSESASSAGETKEASASSTPKPASPMPPSTVALTDAADNRADTAATSNSGRLECSTVALGFSQDLTIVGGIAVPFYVILLAMFGAGINMTLKVPAIQGTSDVCFLSQAKSTLSSEDQRKMEAGVRLELIQNYMYLLSAPFLAIAMYYLLQLLAQEVAEPVLVIMAFATGLVSKAVVQWIINFAETALSREKPGPKQADAEAAAAAAARAAEEAGARQRAAEAATIVAKDASTKQAAAEAAAKAAAEEANTMQAAAEAIAEPAEGDEEAKRKAKEAARAVQEARARQRAADAVAKAAAEEAKERLEEEERAKRAAAKAADEAKVQQDEAEAAQKAVAKAAEEAKSRTSKG